MNILKQSKQILTRVFFSLIIVIIFIPFLVIGKYAGTPGRIISSIFYILIGMLGYFELLRLFKFSKVTSALSVLVIPFFMFINYKTYEGTVKFGVDYNFNDLIYNQFINLNSLYISIIFVFIPLISEFILFNKKTSPFKIFTIFLISFILPIFIKSFWLININSLAYVSFFIGVAVISDTSAYIGGMLFGKKWFKGAKFAPNISPKKTWAGYVVSVVITTLYTALVGYYGNIWHPRSISPIYVSIIFAIVVSVVGPYGDLLFSLIKRKENVKDFSNLIPGHGGVFDRVDSMSLIFTIVTITYLII